MNRVKRICLTLSLGIAITIIVINAFPGSDDPAIIASLSPPVLAAAPASRVPIHRISKPVTWEEAEMSPAGSKEAVFNERVYRSVSTWNLDDRNLEQLFAVMWQAIEFENDEDADFQGFILATLEAHHNLAPGDILAELIRTAPTTQMLVDTLHLLAEASQEIPVTPLANPGDKPRQPANNIFDDLSVNELLLTVAEVIRKGNQRERLTALSTLEEMHRFAPIWEVAHTVLDDPDLQIRMRALELLTYGDRHEATTQLLIALGDPNPEISALAEKLLIGLEEAPS
jgi:hypothetical protein